MDFSFLCCIQYGLTNKGFGFASFPFFLRLYPFIKYINLNI